MARLTRRYDLDPPFDSITPVFSDSVIAAPEASGNVRHNPMARCSVSTTGLSSIEFSVLSTTGFGTAIGVAIDGVPIEVIQPPPNGVAVWMDLALSAGNHTVEFTEGMQNLAGPVVANAYAVRGSFLQRFRAQPGLAMVAPALPAARIVFYVDSILAGSGADEPIRGGTTGLLRASYPGGVTVDGFSGRALAHTTVGSGDVSLAGLASSLVAAAQQVAAVPTRKEIWIGIGANDFVLTSAATFQATLGSLVDKIRALDTTVTVRCQSLFPRTDIGPAQTNAFGSVLDDFRTAALAVASARPTFCIGHDGLSLATAADLNASGVHFTALGHTHCAAAIRAALGY